MNLTTRIAIAGALLAAMAVPAYAAKDMANEDSGEKAEHGEQRHGGMSGGHVLVLRLPNRASIPDAHRRRRHRSDLRDRL